MIDGRYRSEEVELMELKTALVMLMRRPGGCKPGR
jgi:hypothetical protein